MRPQRRPILLKLSHETEKAERRRNERDYRDVESCQKDLGRVARERTEK
jgi:hypothetical protein